MLVTHATVFKSIEAVDAWDRWFRWRADGRLRDVTVADTWRRVTRFLAGRAPLDADYWAARFEDAFSQWRLLPTPAWLRHAGTGIEPDVVHAGCAINLAAHLVSTPSGLRLDDELLADTAALAVRLVDDMVCGAPQARTLHAQISVLGLGTAIAALRLGYGRAGARSWARDRLRIVSDAGWCTNMELAAERGPRVGLSRAQRSVLLGRGMAQASCNGAERAGLRFHRLTRVDAHPELARFANVTDGLQPVIDPKLAPCAMTAELKMRACLRPWLDSAPDLPLVLPSACTQDPEHGARLAGRLGLPMPFVQRSHEQKHHHGDLR